MLDSTQSPSMDFVWTRINGIHKRRVNRRSVKLYYVASGHLAIRGDTFSGSASACGIIVVPPGTWCELEGEAAEVGLACSPAFDSNDEEIA